MPFTLEQTLVDARLSFSENEGPEGTTFSLEKSGDLQIWRPGRLRRWAAARVRRRVERVSDVDAQSARPEFITTPIPVELKVFDPKGDEFTRDEVTLGDLAKFRDRRGVPVGRWRYALRGQSQPQIHEPGERLLDAWGELRVELHETIESESAPPLVQPTRLTSSTTTAAFELNRVGHFVATITSAAASDRWNGQMRLIDPDGVVLGQTSSRELRCPVGLSTLGRPRDSAGNPRMFRLEVEPQGGVVVGDHYVEATVLGEGRISVSELQSRVQKLIGEHGAWIKIYGNTDADGPSELLIRVTDVAAAETLDMWDAFKNFPKKDKERPLEDRRVLYSAPSLSHGLAVDLRPLHVRSIDVQVGPGSGLGAETPALRLAVRVGGEASLTFRGQKLASLDLDDCEMQVELGIRIHPDGTPYLVYWYDFTPLDIDLSLPVLALVAVLPLGIPAGAAGVPFLEHLIESKVREAIKDAFAKLGASAAGDPVEKSSPATLRGAGLLMSIFGAHLTHRAPRFDGADVLFEHIAPPEPEPKPRPDYTAAIGRIVLNEGAGAVRFLSNRRGDTWAADKLKAKIEHIVVVMMENRSYDHVLGYRSLDPISDGADGWSSELMAAVNQAALAVEPLPAPDPEPRPPVQPLRNAKFRANAEGFLTRLPTGVGHELADVSEQLSVKMPGPAGHPINDPRGFVENYRRRQLKGEPQREVRDPDDPNQPAGIVTQFDVLGYYGKDDLPITTFFAKNFAYSDTYFCSHPGPTLPNRMLSLTGDVQHDRVGVPILDNNHGDQWVLSRAHTIYDLLERRGISWRVYESFPSVTMLRMFARYATDDVHIKRLEDFEHDAAEGTLPSFCAVEPAMHAHPQDDDHPDADMYRGQRFLRRVYAALRNGKAWDKTLLIVTYDEHGGFYDHVIPPAADVLGPVRADVTGAEGGRRPGEASGGLDRDAGESPLAIRLGRAVHFESAGTITNEATAPRHFQIVREAFRFPTGSAEEATEVPAEALVVPYGVRVPTLVISPWVMPGKGPNVVLDHCSILKTVLARFCGDERPFLSDRVHASNSFESFLNAPEPRDVDLPVELDDLPPGVRRVVSSSSVDTPPLDRERMREGPVDFHDLSGRWARALGR